MYNGFTNHATWSCNCWILNEYGWLEAIKEALKEFETLEDKVDYLKDEWSRFILCRLTIAKNEEEQIAILQEHWDGSEIDFEQLIEHIEKNF